MNKEYLSDFSKEEIYDLYDAVVTKNKKLYDNITKNKMIDMIFKEYQDYHNIISICTLKELNLLKKIVAKGSLTPDEYDDNEENDFIIDNLENKLLITTFGATLKIMDGLEEVVKTAVENMKVSEIKRQEKLIIPLLGLLKVMGIEQLSNLVLIIKNVYNVDKELDTILSHSLLFNYYCFITDIDEFKFVAIYRPYIRYIDELVDLYKNKEFGIKMFNDEILTSIFYYEYDKKDKTVSKLMQRLNYRFIREDANLIALFDADRKQFKNLVSNELTSKEVDTLLNKLPSSAYKGLSKKQYAKIILEEKKASSEMDYNYKKQTASSCLSAADSDLFYKTYFAILEYTNNYYHVNKIKIYKQKGINPSDLVPVITKFIENKETLVEKFIKENPYKFNQEELDIVRDYKKGLAGLFMIVKYEKDYTMIISIEKAYMVKGLTCPIDEIVPYNELPCPAMIRLLPFKGMIIYDGILASYGESIKMSAVMRQKIIAEAESLEKNYHL